MKWLHRGIDLILYSNVWIATAAVLMTWQTELLLLGRFGADALSGFVFCATLALYALHRTIGLGRLGDLALGGRFIKIAGLRPWLISLAITGGIGSLWFFTRLPPVLQKGLIPPALISLAYVLPVFGRGRRLRDLPLLKIWLIAFTWAWVSVILPALQSRLGWNLPALLLFLERFFFILAITIPFDIRDLKIDAHEAVQTLPSIAGARRAKMIAAGSLLAMCFFAGLNWWVDVYTTGQFSGLMISTVVALTLILAAGPRRHDYYFTGLLDGAMILQFLLVLGLGGFPL